MKLQMKGRDPNAFELLIVKNHAKAMQPHIFRRVAHSLACLNWLYVNESRDSSGTGGRSIHLRRLLISLPIFLAKRRTEADSLVIEPP